METCLIYYKPPLKVCPVHTWVHRPHERHELILRPTRKDAGCSANTNATPAPGALGMRNWNMGMWSS